jgi:hypothetical protein
MVSQSGIVSGELPRKRKEKARDKLESPPPLNEASRRLSSLAIFRFGVRQPVKEPFSSESPRYLKSENSSSREDFSELRSGSPSLDS